jgi:uncharacterized protein
MKDNILSEDAKQKSKAVMNPELNEKWQGLLRILRDMIKVNVAFSGGVDSSLLSYAAFRALGDDMQAYTIHSRVDAPGDLENAVSMAEQVGFSHQVLEYDDLQLEEFVSNPVDRCYHCKLGRFKLLRDLAEGFVLEGSNVDDLGDYRPGIQAVQQLGIRSPLIEAGLRKQDVRELARVFKLPVWDNPSSPCLATRFPYGTRINHEGLIRIGRAETFLHSLGIGSARGRYYGDLAKIEVQEDQFDRVINNRSNIVSDFQDIGFKFVSLDLEGFQSGKMNRMLK